MTGKDFAKKTAHFGLSASIIATKALKYGVHLSFGVTKCLLGGAKSLAKEFSGNSFETGIGDFVLKEGEKAINYGFDKLISAQQYLEGKCK